MVVDWNTTLSEWSPSAGAIRVTEEGRIDEICRFCNYVAKNLWGKIEFFDLTSMRQLGGVKFFLSDSKRPVLGLEKESRHEDKFEHRSIRV